MAFRINNTLTKAEYGRICRKLAKDWKSGNGEEEDLESILTEEPGTSLILLDWHPLDSPLSQIGGMGVRKANYNKIFTQDHKTYSIWFTIKFEPEAQNIYHDVVAGMRANPPYGFELDSGERLITVRKGNLSYLLNLDSDGAVRIRLSANRRISVENVTEDISNVLVLTGSFINTAYSLKDKQVNFELSTIVSEKSKNFIIMRMKDEMDRSHADKIALERPKLTFDQIGGCTTAKEELTMLAHGLKNPKSYMRWGINYPRGIILYGLPGTGKTMLAKAMANLAAASLYSVSTTDVISHFYGQSLKLVAEVFDIAKKNAPAIILFDEIDSLVRRREDVHEESGKIVSVFLQNMDGIKALDKVIVIGTTNQVGIMDPAILRPGRFDKIIEVTPPDSAARAGIFKLHCNGRRVEQNIDFNALAEKSDGFTGADIAELIQVSLGKKLKEEMASGREIPPLSFDELAGSINEYRKNKKVSMVVKDSPDVGNIYR